MSRSAYIFSSPDPTITVSVASSVATPMVGSMYSLTCTVTGAERLTDAMVTYQWLKNGVEASGQTMATLFFSPLTFCDAGRYTCQATVISSLLSGPISSNSANSVGITPALVGKFINVTINQLCTVSNSLIPAVYLSLGGIHITNDSYVDMHDIGEGDNGALLCVTDLMQCCHDTNTATGTALGQWISPNGTDVPIIDRDGHDFYCDRGHNIVRLNRRNNATSPTGLYCCEVPDSTFTTRRVCANIGGFVHVFDNIIIIEGMFRAYSI